MSLQVIIRSGKQAASAIDAFYKSVHSVHRAREEDVFFLLMNDECVVGAVRHCFEHDTSLLRSMNIHPDFRGNKLGLQLLKKFETYLHEHRIHETFCIPYAHLIHFYGQIGFKQIAEKEAPLFLQKRIAEYRTLYTDKSYSMMKRSSL